MPQSPHKPLHIALVSRYYPPDPGGGLALYTRQIAEEIVRQGHRVWVVSAAESGMPEMLQEHGVCIYRILQRKKYDRSLLGGTCLFNSIEIAKTLAAVHQQHRLDVIQSPATFFEPLAYGALLKNRLGIPLVIKFHENRETYERVEGKMKTLKRMRRRWLRQLMRKTALHADYWLGVSQSALESTLDYLNLRQHNTPQSASPSAIDFHMFRSTSAPPGYFTRYDLPEDAPFLLYSGRLIHEKGLHLLVDAFLQGIAHRYPDLHLAVAGEFDYRQPHYETRILSRMAGHPASKRIHLLGRVPYAELPYWYSRCRIFVGPSFCEPFGRVFVEAMACEAPVISFNSGGPKEFITHRENGFMVDNQTAEGLEQAIYTLLDTPELLLKLKHNSRPSVQNRFSQERIAQDLIRLYWRLAYQPHQTVSSG